MYETQIEYCVIGGVYCSSSYVHKLIVQMIKINNPSFVYSSKSSLTYSAVDDMNFNDCNNIHMTLFLRLYGMCLCANKYSVFLNNSVISG